MRRFLPVFACAAAIACSQQQALPPAAAPPSAPGSATQLSCDWPGFAENGSVTALEQAFGAPNVKAMDGEDGIVPVLIYPDDPTRRVHINLYPGTERPFSGAAVEDRASTWTLPGGVAMGSSLADVARANGGPFGLYLYAGGAGVEDWRGGALGAGACSYFVAFEHSDKALTSPRRVMSDDPALSALAMTAHRFGVN